MKAGLDHLADADRVRVGDFAERFQSRQITRALEVLGQALVDMHQAPDSRICLEVALVRLTNPDTDPSPSALADRLDRLERTVAKLSVAPTSPPAPASGRTARSTDEPPGTRAALGGVRAAAASPATPKSSEEEPPPPAPIVSRKPSGPLPTRDELTLAWGDHVLARLPTPAKPRFGPGRFVAVEADAAIFAVPNPTHRARCEECRDVVEAALAEHFGRPVPIRLVVDGEHVAATPAPAARPEPEDVVDVNELVDAPPDGRTHLDLLTEAFPGSEMVDGG
jgi:DNA polymerase III gamma/tau subunit